MLKLIGDDWRCNRHRPTIFYILVDLSLDYLKVDLFNYSLFYAFTIIWDDMKYQSFFYVMMDVSSCSLILYLVAHSQT